MKIVAILSQKGGTGKTTLGVHLAVAALNSGIKSEIVDLDQQASASAWKDQREQATPEVTSVAPGRLAHALKAAEKRGAEFVVIDTAPHSESAALDAARVADLVLVPCRPGYLDVHAIGRTANLISLTSKTGFVVLTQVPPRALTIVVDATQAVATYGLKVAPTEIHLRAAYSHAIPAGLVAEELEPAGKAAEEMSALFSWLSGQLGMKARKRATKA
jgi:chromosome partitioning protein